MGLVLSRVQGIPTPDEFWQHTDQDSSASPKGQGLTELARATNLGDKGWTFDHEYVFTFEFNETSLKVYVDGTLEISIAISLPMVGLLSTISRKPECDIASLCRLPKFKIK